jgi:hypothetical protein
MSIFDQILEGVTDEDKAVIAKYPQLKDTVTKLETAYADADTRLTGWEDWRKEHFDDSAGTTKETVALRERVAQMEAAGATEMTFDQIKEQLQKEGFVATKQDIDAALAERTKGFISVEDHNKSLNTLAAGFENAFVKGAPLPLLHKEEFGEKLDLGAVLKYGSEHGIYDPEKAWNEMMAPRRAEKAAADRAAAEAKHQEELAAAEKRGEEKVRQELAMSASGNPSLLGGPAPYLGQLDNGRMPEGSTPTDLPEAVKTAKLGDMKTAQAVFDKFRADHAAKVQ